MQDDNPYRYEEDDLPPPRSPSSVQADSRKWAMLIHLSQLANLVAPLCGFVAPILIWQIQKEQMPELDAHGHVVTNWMISSVIYFLICIPLCFILVGFVLISLLVALMLIYPIIGGIKAGEGIVWRYPGSIRFF